MSRYSAVPQRKPSYNHRSRTPRLLSTREAAEYLGIGANAVRNYVNAGDLKAFRIGASKGKRVLLKFDPQELDRFAASQTSGDAA